MSKDVKRNEWNKLNWSLRFEKKTKTRLNDFREERAKGEEEGGLFKPFPQNIYLY